MLSDAQRDYIRKVTLTVQIIVGALAGGVLMFLAIVIYLVLQNPPVAGPETPIITYSAYGMAVANVIAALAVANFVSNRARQSLINNELSRWGLVKNLPNAAELGDVAPLAAVYQTRTIIGVALLEGAAFFACVAYMLEHQRPMLVLVWVLLLMIASYIPTASGLESWIKRELATIEQMHQLRR